MAANSTLPQGAVVAPPGVQQVTGRPGHPQGVPLQRVPSGGRLAGFGNMLGKELGDWFKTRRWLIQMLAWLVIINGFVAFVLWLVPILEETAQSQGQPSTGIPAAGLMGLTLFFSFLVQIGSIGVVVVANDEVVGEKQSGTAAWVLSKPASRSAFVLSKLVADMVGILLFIVALPALVAYAEIWIAAGNPPDVPSFLLGLGSAILPLLFYLTFVLMLSVLFNQRGPVLGVAFGLLFGIMFMAGFVPEIGYALPAGFDQVALALALGMPLSGEPVFTMVATAAWTVVFTAVALWRFQRQEL